MFQFCSLLCPRWLSCLLHFKGLYAMLLLELKLASLGKKGHNFASINLMQWLSIRMITLNNLFRAAVHTRPPGSLCYLPQTSQMGSFHSHSVAATPEELKQTISVLFVRHPVNQRIDTRVRHGKNSTRPVQWTADFSDAKRRENI